MRSRSLRTILALSTLLATAALAASPAPRWELVEQHGDVPPGIWEAGISFARTGGVPDTLYRFGGQSGVFPVDFPVNDFYALDLATATWTNLASPETPGARANTLLIPGPCRDCVSIVGGRGQFGTGAMFPEMWTYHTRSGEWTQAPPRERGRLSAVHRAAAVVVAVPDPRSPLGKLFYAFGGVGNTLPNFPTTPTGLRNDVAVYEPATGWRPVETFGKKPPPRAWSSGAYDPAGNSLLIFSGYRLGRDQGPGTTGAELFGPTNFTNDLWSLSLDTFTWTRLQPSGPRPTPRDNAAVFFDASRGSLVVFGGQGFDRVVNDLWVYSVAANRWTRMVFPPGAPVPPGRVGGVSFLRERPRVYELYVHSGALGEGDGTLLNDLWKLTWPKR
jgi:hypothetical protein